MGTTYPGHRRWRGNPCIPSGASGHKQEERSCDYILCLNSISLPYLIALCFLSLSKALSQAFISAEGSEVYIYVLPLFISLGITAILSQFLSILVKWMCFGTAQPGMILKETMSVKLTADFVSKTRNFSNGMLAILWAHSPLQNVLLMLYGGRMAASSHAATLIFDPMEADLISPTVTLTLTLTLIEG